MRLPLFKIHHPSSLHSSPPPLNIHPFPLFSIVYLTLNFPFSFLSLSLLSLFHLLFRLSFLPVNLFLNPSSTFLSISFLILLYSKPVPSKFPLFDLSIQFFCHSFIFVCSFMVKSLVFTWFLFLLPLFPLLFFLLIIDILHSIFVACSSSSFSLPLLSPSFLHLFILFFFSY